MKKNRFLVSMFNSLGKPLSRGFLLISLSLAILSCGSGGGSTANLVNLPQDVSFVFSVDAKRLSSKSESWRELFSRDFLESMDIDLEEGEVYLEKLLNSGISLDSKSYFFGSLSPEEKDNYIGFTFVLDNPSKFKSALEEAIEQSTESDKPEIVEQNGYTMMMQDNADLDVVLGWKGKTVLLLGIEDRLPKADFLAKFDAVFNTSEENSLKNSVFLELDGEKNDMALWMDQQKIYALYQEADEYGSGLSFLDELWPAMQYSTAAVSFKKGEVVVEATTFLDEEVSKTYEELFKNGIKDAFVNSIPIQVPSLILGMDFNMPVLFELLKDEEDLMESEESLQRQYDINMKELFEMFDGEFFLVSGDLKIDEILKDPQPEFTMAVGIENKPTLDKLLKGMVEERSLEDKGDYFSIPAPNPFYLIEKDKALYLTMSADFRDKLIAGEGAMEGIFKKKSSSKVFVMFYNLQEIFRQIPDDYRDFAPVERRFWEVVAPKLESLISDYSPAKNHKISGEIILSFTEKGQNSLETIVQMIKAMNVEEEPVSMLEK